MSDSIPPPIRAKASEPPPLDLNPRREPVLDFPDRELAAMTAADYDALGFLCGLEVHQQLATRGKLFCRCPAGRNSKNVDAEVLRHMRPTLSEMGEYDGTALMEFKTRKDIVYRLERTSVCTYEMDDTPPFPIDSDAVRRALEISKLFGLDLISELHVMRKQYLDGSIPTGFQRTAMIGLGGAIPFRDSELGPRELRIRQLSLEEDSCREISDVGHRITFRTDRLGVPLIETVTEPDLLTPHDVAAGGRLLAAVARASGKVLRGPGAARQDVNVSIAGSRRVEIKGVGSHGILPLLVHNEAFRHLNLLRVQEQLRSRGATAQLFPQPGDGAPWDASPLLLDARTMLANTGHLGIARAIESGHMVCAVRLPLFGGLLAHRTQRRLTFLHEIAERVRVIACPVDRGFMTSSEHDSGLGDGVWRTLRDALRADSGDAILLLWMPIPDAATAVREVLARAAEALVGVPSETRQANPDGTTGFERILPGAQRMYPDTDTPPLPIPDAWIDAIDLSGIELPWAREDRYVAAGLEPRAARRLARAVWAGLFDALEPRRHETARRLAHALEKRLVHFWREQGARRLPDPSRLRPLVAAVDAGEVEPAAFEYAFDRLLRESGNSDAIVAEHRPAHDGDDDLDARARQLAGARPTSPRGGVAATLRWAMGTLLQDQRRGALPVARARALAVGSLELEGL